MMFMFWATPAVDVVVVCSGSREERKRKRVMKYVCVAECSEQQIAVLASSQPPAVKKIKKNQHKYRASMKTYKKWVLALSLPPAAKKNKCQTQTKNDEK